MDWTGKAAIITGGASGIGAATAREFAARGVTVGLLDIDETRGRELEAALRSEGHGAHFFRCNVADAEACREAVSAFATQTGRIDYLINNAASFLSVGLDAVVADWDHALSVNVRGGAIMAQLCYPVMKQTGGAIVNLASISGHIAQPNRWTYNACKGAIISMTRCMALDLAHAKIRANSVSPGWTWTPEVAKAAVGGRDKWEPIWGKFCMLGRLAEAEEVARPILFLCSDDASYITGVDLPIDGGYLALGSEGQGGGSHFAGSR